MKNSFRVVILKSLVLVIFVSLFSLNLAGISDAKQVKSKELVCKIECSKKSNIYQQSCSAYFNEPLSKGFHDTDRLISCVQSVKAKVNSCVKQCLGVKLIVKDAVITSKVITVR